MKAASKHSLDRFQELVSKVRASTPLNLSETPAQKTQRLQTLRGDYAAFVEYYFPHYAAPGTTAAFQISAANAAKRNPHDRRVVQWARGHAKSTHFGMMIPLWLKAQNKPRLHTMVLVGKSEVAATRLLSDLQAELEANQRYIADFGAQIQQGAWEEGEFATRDGCFFKALGRGQSPRGIKNKQHRPDYICLDDVDDDEICQSEKRLEKLYDWCIEALLGTMHMGRGRFLVVGNKISKNSIVHKFEKNPAFKTTIVNALDKRGKPSWKEVFTLAEIQQHIQTLGYRASQKELFNNPIVAGSVFSNEWIRYEKPLPYHQYQGLIAYCDPSFKDGATADYKAIVVVGKTGRSLHILHAFVRKCSVNAMVQFFYDLHEKLDGKAICDYYMEANFIQDLLLEEFKTEGNTRGYQLPIRGDCRNKPNKYQRIEALSPLFERGLIALSSTQKDDADMMRLVEQLLAFGKGNRTHDDAPDALEGAVSILNIRHRTSNYKPRFGKRFPTKKY